LGADKDQAGEKYEEIRWKLVKFFQWNSCATAEELADETFDRVARKLNGGQEIENLLGFIWVVARNVGLEGRRRERKTLLRFEMLGEGAVSDHGAAVDSLHQKIQNHEELRCLRACMGRLSAGERALLLAYRAGPAHYAKARKRLAAKLAITPGVLRVRVLRLRAKLEDCMRACLARDRE
jgi:DNA-directed RNA polymerase specialized sigma24 family protein